MRSRNRAIIIGYATIGVSMLSGMLLIPFYLKHLGIDNYGLYQYIFAIAQYAYLITVDV